MRPSFAAAVGFVNAITDGKIGARKALAACDINDIRVRRGDRDCTDRLRELRIEDRQPSAAVVGGFPNAAIDGADIENVRLAWDAGQSARAPTTKWPDHAPAQPLIRGLRKLLRHHTGR